MAIQNSIENLMHKLYPIHRSQTGDGVRQTLEMLSDFGLAIRTIEVPSGEKVFDWEVPPEWQINDAFIKDADGNRLVDYNDSNLHVLNGSTGIEKRMALADLEPYLHVGGPDTIPYRTAFFADKWGFCLSQNQYDQMQQGREPFHVCIDAKRFDGSLTIGEAELKGESDEVVIIWTHTCHPSLANDNVSGIAAAAGLYRKLEMSRRKFTYRFVFAPATIGAITWLAKNENSLGQIKFGLVLCLLGDERGFTFKTTRRTDHLIDRCLQLIASTHLQPIDVIPFSPIGYDERQFCSPGIDLPFARISRATENGYPEYHSSGDSLSLISENRIMESVDMVYSVLKTAEDNCLPINTSPKCEPRLGSAGLFARHGEERANSASQRSILWTLNLSDGQHDALAISERSGIPFEEIAQAIFVLADHGFLEVKEAI